MEKVIDDHYKEQAFLTSAQQAKSDAVSSASYDHETLGRAIIDQDDELGAVLRKHGYSSDDLKSLFSRELPGFLLNLVSSALDCDRLDYLVRSARATGLPYGQVDVEYITNQVCVDDD